MACTRLIPLLLATALWVAAVPKTQERPDTIPPGRTQASESARRFEKSLHQDRPRPAVPQADWEKARADAARLLTLAQEINGQLQAGPQQIPAPLTGELKEAEKLVKRLRRELLF
jgi:hypothetical protein